MLVPLKDAPVTASVSCWPSEAKVVPMLVEIRARVRRFGQRRLDRVDRGDDRLIAVVAVSSMAWLCDITELEAVTMPLSAVRCWAIDQ